MAEKLKTLSYILFEDHACNEGAWMLGFHRYNTPGYIDCGSGWDDDQREEFQDNVLDKLGKYIHTFESYEFTYEVKTVKGLEAKLKKMGIARMEPEFID